MLIATMAWPDVIALLGQLGICSDCPGGASEAHVSLTLGSEPYQRLLKEDLDWLLLQARSLERDHLECLLRAEMRLELFRKEGLKYPDNA